MNTIKSLNTKKCRAQVKELRKQVKFHIVQLNRLAKQIGRVSDKKLNMCITSQVKNNIPVYALKIENTDPALKEEKFLHLERAIEMFRNDLIHAQEWIDDLTHRLCIANQECVFSLLSSILQEFRNGLPIEKVTIFGKQLPTILRGFYYDNWYPIEVPLKKINPDGLRETIKSKLFSSHHENVDTEFVVKSVLLLLHQRIPNEIVELINTALPAHLTTVCPDNNDCFYDKCAD